MAHHPFTGTEISYKSENGFAWGVGGRAILAYWGDIQLGLNAEYMASDPSLSSLSVDGRAYSVGKSEVDYCQWQIGLGASYRLGWFIPYFGVNYINLKEKFRHLDSIVFVLPKGHVTFKSDNPYGVYLGFGVSFPRALQVNFEARFINENAVSVSADFKF